MVSVDEIQFVRKLALVKCVPIREIVRRTGLSRNTIRKILRSDKTKFEYKREVTHSPILGDYIETIEKWLTEDQQVGRKYRRSARRLCDILKQEHGYEGSYESVARQVRELRKELSFAHKEAYLPLYFEPGDAFQFDWGEVQAKINGRLIKLQLAITQLCHSRVFFAHAYPNQKQELLFDAHCRAFDFFGGVCKRGIYDNMKTAVVRVLKGRTRNLSEHFTRLCSHYLFEPDFCNVARGNEKGRVENLVGTIRRNFFSPIPDYESLDDLHATLRGFCLKFSRTKEHPEFKGLTRYAVYEKEKISDGKIMSSGLPSEFESMGTGFISTPRWIDTVLKQI